MKEKLDALPLVTQLPLGQGRELRGILDLLSMDILLWSSDHSNDGAEFRRVPLLGVSGTGLKDYGDIHGLLKREAEFSGLLSKEDLKAAIEHRKLLAEQVSGWEEELH